MAILKSPLSKQSKFDKPIKWWKYKFVRNFFLYPIHTLSIVNGKNQSSNSFQWFSWMSTHCEHCVTMLANCQIQWNERNSFILSVVALYSGKRKCSWIETRPNEYWKQNFFYWFFFPCIALFQSFNIIIEKFRFAFLLVFVWSFFRHWQLLELHFRWLIFSHYGS